MCNKEFIEKCKELVSEYSSKYYGVGIGTESVYVVWSCKTLQNSKALLCTSVSDGMYYELTYNGDKEEIYFDVYKKQENKCIKF